jgi:predicted dehydrogenase
MLKVGIIGCGYWGTNLIRNFFENPSCYLSHISDGNQDALEKIRQRFPSLQATTDPVKLIESKELDAIVVATPLEHHFELAKQALLNNKHVMIEKPLASTEREAEELVRLAEKRKLVLMVDHTFIYSGAVRKVKEIIDDGELGDIFYFDSVRVNLGLFRTNQNVVWDLGPHDFSIMDYLFDQTPVSVSAYGTSHFKNEIENIAYVIVRFKNNFIAHYHFNWLAPTKVRCILIGGSRKMIVYNDLETDEKVKVYSKSVLVKNSLEGMYRPLYDYRVGDMYSPKVDLSEALQKVCQEFADSVAQKRCPLTDGLAGLRNVRILEATQKSILSGGKTVKLA